MVQFFGNSQTGLGRLGQALSGGLAEGAQYGVNRGRLQDAFAPLLQDPRFADLAKIAPALLTAPGGSQALSEIAPILLQSALNKQAPQANINANVNPQMGQPNQAQPSNIEQFNQQRTTNRSPLNAQQIGQAAAQGVIAPLKSSENAGALNTNPQVPAEYRKRVSPGDILNQKQEARNQGFLPAQVKQLEEDINAFNEGLITQDELDERNYQRNISRQDDLRKIESDTLNFINEKIPGANDDDKEIAYGIFKDKFKPGDDFTRVWNQIKTTYTNLVKEKQNFTNAVKDAESDPIFGLRDRQIDKFKGAAKKIISDNPFMKNVLMDTMLKEGQNIYDTDQILSKPQPKISNVLKDAQDFRKLVYGTPQGFGAGGFGGSTGVLNQVFKMQSEGTNKLFNELKDSITPETSLVNIYKDLKVKAWMPEFIQDIFNKLSEAGALTPQQEQEKTLLLQDPKLLPKHLGFFE